MVMNFPIAFRIHFCIMRFSRRLMFACHGLDQDIPARSPRKAKRFRLDGGRRLVEIVCGFLVAFGLLTRLAAFVASGECGGVFHDACANRV